MKKFIAGKTVIPVSGQVIADEDVTALHEVVDSRWYTDSKACAEFRRNLGKYFGKSHVTLTNSGSSASLVAVSTAIEKVEKDTDFRDFRYVVTTALAFPTTVAPIYQTGKIPFYVDIDPKTLTPDMDQLLEIWDKLEWNIAGAVFTHMLGFPFDEQRISKLFNFLIADCCFVGNTTVASKSDRERPFLISDVMPGDILCGYDESTGRFKDTKVVEVFSRLVPLENIVVITLENGKKIRCTDNHPFLVDGKWVLAGDLTVSSELWTCPWDEYVSWRRKEYQLTDGGRKVLSDHMKVNNPSYDPEVVKKSATNRYKRPSHIEKRVMKVSKENDLPIEYVGNSKLWIGNKSVGYRNPDFIVSGTNKVIEVYDPTYRYGVYRGDEWKAERELFYSDFGYKTYFVPLSGWINRQQQEQLLLILRGIISNGAKIISIERLTNKRNWAYFLNMRKKEPEGMIRVYNVTCDPYPTFIVGGGKKGSSGIITHNCDAVGAEFNNFPVGTFSQLMTLSFFPAHHITAGEGGAVLTNMDSLAKIADSYVNWGRSCYCNPGQSNTCGKRFEWDTEELPEGWDHKYIFDRLGYNLKMTEFQAALGNSQLSRVDEFVLLRIHNFDYYLIELDKYSEFIEFVTPLDGGFPSPFGFPIIVKETSPFTVTELIAYLESRKVTTRRFFGGNLTKQPAFRNMPYQFAGSLAGTDYVANNGMWIGVQPSLTDEMKAYVVQVFEDFFKSKGL